MGNEKFIGHIDEELERLKNELDKVKENMESAQQILAQSKEKQDKLKQELIAVDSMKRAYGQLSQEVQEPEVEESKDENLQQPPEGYNENEGQQ